MTEKFNVLEAIVNAVETAPKQIRPLLEHELGAAFAGILYRIKALHEVGDFIPAKSCPSMRAVFDGATVKDSVHTTSATVRDIAGALADSIDAGVKRVVLEASQLDHAAVLDLIEGHAKITRGLANLVQDSA